MSAEDIEPFFGASAGFFGVPLCGVGKRDSEDDLSNMIEDDHGIVEGEGEIGQLAIIKGDVGEVFCVANDVIRGIPHSATEEPGESGEVDGLVAGDTGVEDFKGVGVVNLFPVATSGLNNYGSSACGDGEEGLTADEAETSDFFAADNAFEEECEVSGGDSLVGSDGGQCVSGQLSIDRNKPGLLSELFELGGGGQCCG